MHEPWQVFGVLATVLLAILVPGVLCAQEKQANKAIVQVMPAVTLENQCLRITLNEKARVIGLIDRVKGEDYCGKSLTPFLVLRKGGNNFTPSACSYQGGNRYKSSSRSITSGRLTVEFGEASVTTILEVNIRKQYFVFKVLSVSDQNLEELSFLNLRVKTLRYVSGMSGMAADDYFAFCLRVLNLQTNAEIAGAPTLLKATCYPRYGLVGAGAALVSCPTKQLREVLKEVFRNEGLPVSPLGGPWALDAPENKASYLFASVSENNVDEWIEMAKRSGTPIIHLCGWERTLGHYEPRPDLFPHGLVGLRQVADKIHAAGLRIGMHTLTGCISPYDSFVTPVPDQRLAKRCVFTLAEPLGDKDKEVTTVEPLTNMDTIWAYASRGNVIQIDDELIQYTGFSKDSPFKLTRCKRGAFGTKAALHEKGAKVNYLHSSYGAFYPDEQSTLVDEVAQCIANVANECRFDFLYMDGSEGMPGDWYGVARMRAAIFSKIDHPIRIEASSWGYHSWPFHSCIGAWDYPCWGLKRFIDIHCQSNQANRENHLLATQLGWWSILGPHEDHDGEFPDEIEYLCGKALGHDVGMSFEDVQPGLRPANARQNEYLTLIGRYERLRLAGYFSDAVLAKLRTPREEFRLLQSPEGEWQFLPTDYLAHKVTGFSNGTNTWTINNRYDSQPVKLRIQALYSVAPYDSPKGQVLADFRVTNEFSIDGAAKDVNHSFISSSATPKGGDVNVCYTAENKRRERQGTWTKASKKFSTEKDLSQCGALGVWVYGDGKREILNFQLSDPPQYYHGSSSEHYVDVDFTGWRYFELPFRERDSERHADYQWPYDGVYEIYRTPLVRKHVSDLKIYYNNLPPGDTVKCTLSPLKALPLVKAKIVNPTVTVGDSQITFPVILESGQYLEYESPTNCRVFDERGELLQNLTFEAKAPCLNNGENKMIFTCEEIKGYNARVRITVISQGKPLQGTTPKDKIDWRWLRTEYDDPRIIQALDGQQNEWETFCRPKTKGASLQIELVVDRKNVVTDPILCAGKQKLIFPVSMSAGERLVFKGMNDCSLFAKDGSTKQKVKPVGGPLTVKPGRNSISFSAKAENLRDFQMRVLLTKVYR